MQKKRIKSVWVDELDAEAPDVRDISIIEDDEWQPTGILDISGNEIYASDRAPVGIRLNRPQPRRNYTV